MATRRRKSREESEGRHGALCGEVEREPGGGFAGMDWRIYSSGRGGALKSLKNEPMAMQMALISAEVLRRRNAAQAAIP